MKTDNVIIFFGKRFELCKAFGLFGKENLSYQSKFDHTIYNNSDYIKYFFPELNCDVLFLSHNTNIDTITKEYNGGIIMLSEMDIYNKIYEVYRQKYPNFKLAFLWMYGEVLSKTLFQKCKEANLDLIMSASNQFGINDIAIFDPKLSFKFFYYYIGYYYLTELIENLSNKVYDKTKLPIFTYSKALNQSSWRSDILNKLHLKYPNKIQNGNSINDSYDLEFTKYKHFETINDYSYKNYNLIFETINYTNDTEYFITEKTFKGLFFGNPFFLVAPKRLVEQVSKDFYLLNSEFETVDDFVGCDNLEERFEEFQQNSKVNYYKLLEYIKDYKYTEHFKKLLYGT